MAVPLQISQLVTAFSQRWTNRRNFWMRSINSHLQRSSATMRFFISGVDVEDLKGRLGICVFALDPWYFDDQLLSENSERTFPCEKSGGAWELDDYDSGIIASGALFLYLKETQKTALSHMASIRPYSAEKYMLIDSSSQSKSGACGNHARKTEKRFSSLGTGQDQRQLWEPEHFGLMWNSL